MCLGCLGLEGSAEIREAFVRAGVAEKMCEVYSQMIVTRRGIKHALSEPVDAFGVPLRQRVKRAAISIDVSSFSSTASMSSASSSVAPTARTLPPPSTPQVPLSIAPRKWWRRFPPPPKMCFACDSDILFPTTADEDLKDHAKTAGLDTVAR
jgi:hypothetical protein